MSLTIKNFVNTVEIVQNTIDKFNLKIGAAIVSQTKVLCPVAQKFGGTLRNSYMYITNLGEGGFNDSPGEKAKEKIKGNVEKNTGYVGSNVEYSIYQEFGTRKMKPQPHLIPAIDYIIKGKNADKIIQEITKLQKEHLARIGK